MSDSHQSPTGSTRARKAAQKTAASAAHEPPSASAATNSSATASSKPRTSGSTARPTDPKKSLAKVNINFKIENKIRYLFFIVFRHHILRKRRRISRSYLHKHQMIILKHMTWHQL